jgi:hypothetical protein
MMNNNLNHNHGMFRFEILQQAGQTAYNFITHPDTTVKLVGATAKAIAIEGYPIALCAGIDAGFEGGLRAFFSYGLRAFDSSLEMSWMAGALKYSASPKARGNYHDIIEAVEAKDNHTEISYLDKLGYYTYSAMPLAIGGGFNHMLYKVPVSDNFVVLNSYIIGVEAVDAAAQAVGRNINATKIVDGIQSGNVAQIVDGYADGLYANQSLAVAAAKSALISVVSYSGVYLSVAPYVVAGLEYKGYANAGDILGVAPAEISLEGVIASSIIVALNSFAIMAVSSVSAIDSVSKDIASLLYFNQHSYYQDNDFIGQVYDDFSPKEDL